MKSLTTRDIEQCCQETAPEFTVDSVSMGDFGWRVMLSKPAGVQRIRAAFYAPFNDTEPLSPVTYIIQCARAEFTLFKNTLTPTPPA